jgi:hypothetical protein
LDGDMDVNKSILDSVQEFKLFGEEIDHLEYHNIDTASLYLDIHWKSLAFVLRLGLINYSRVNEQITISKKELEKFKSSWFYTIFVNKGNLAPHKKVDKDPVNAFNLCGKDTTKEFKFLKIDKYYTHSYWQISNGFREMNKYILE